MKITRSFSGSALTVSQGNAKPANMPLRVKAARGALPMPWKTAMKGRTPAAGCNITKHLPQTELPQFVRTVQKSAPM